MDKKEKKPINLIEESVKAAIDSMNIYDWTDSVFREHHKYYGDVTFKKSENFGGDHGIVTNKKFMAFRSDNGIGFLSTDFETNIDEKLAKGRKAEYGSKVYTTTNIDQLNVSEAVNALLFDPFSDENLFCGDAKGTMNIFDLKQKASILSVGDLCNGSIFSLAPHPSSSEILCVGGAQSINICDLSQNGKCALNSKISFDDNEQCNVLNMTFCPNASSLRGITSTNYLFEFDPRSNEIFKKVKLRFRPNGIVNLGQMSQIAVCGTTSFLEPIIFCYDIGQNFDESLHEKYLFKQSYKHRKCDPMIKFDAICNLLYVSFKECADVIAINAATSSFEKESLYHSVSDTFLGMDILPKCTLKKREINKIIKLSKDRIQQIVHTRGGKLIYEKLSKTHKISQCSAKEYFENANVEYAQDSIGKLVEIGFEEAKKRSVSIYTHVSGKEANSNYDKYFDLKVAKTTNCVLGLNVKCNAKYALFPSPTYGGGALGIISLKATGRKKQSQLSAHSEKITTFDLCKQAGNECFVISGSADCKAIISKIKEANGQIIGSEQLFSLQCAGKVTFVCFHPRIDGLCVIASNKDGPNNECFVYLYDYKKGKCLNKILLAETKSICHIEIEPVIGLIAAISAPNGHIKIMDLRSGKLLKSFLSNTIGRETTLFWAKKREIWYSQLICLGFGKQSVRKFSVYDLSKVVNEYYAQNVNVAIDGDEKENDQNDVYANDNVDDNEQKKNENVNEDGIECIATHSFGVSNAVPIGYYDGSDNLFYVSSIGGRKIRIYELSEKKGIAEMNAPFQSSADIQGFDFGLKQFVDAKTVQIAKCHKLTKDGVIAPISFFIPRKRTEYFQDDIYSKVLDVANKKIEISLSEFEEANDKNEKLNVLLFYLSLRPKDMKLLSNAPKEELSQHQKKRKSLNKLMEAAKLSEQPQSTEQAFDQFSRMVADAPTANRWDAQNIGTEVAEDEWSD